MALTLDQISQFVCGKVGLFHMLPRQPVKDLADRSARNPVFSSQSSRVKDAAKRQQVTKFPYCLIRQFRAAVLFAVNPSFRMVDRAMPALSSAIPHIVGLSAKKKMSRINTGGVIAMMANTKSFRNWAVGDHPRKSVSGMSSSVQANRAVPERAPRGRPQPTFIFALLFDLAPKSRVKWLSYKFTQVQVYNHALLFPTSACLAM